jgi:hypothetical protein
MKEITVEQYSDGWTVKVDNIRLSWNINDEDLGVYSIKELLEYLGHNVAVEEVY